MHRIADTFGPIPYVNYGSSSLYDALDLVYNKFFEELDNAIEVLSNYVNGNVDAKLMSDYDCVYGGDVEKWVKFANTLRLRLAIRVSYANPTLAEAQAKKSMENMFGFIESKAEPCPNFRIIHWNIIIRCTRLPITSIRVTVVRVLPS